MPQQSIDGIIKPKSDGPRLKQEVDRLRRALRLYRRALISLAVTAVVVGLSIIGVDINHHLSLPSDPIPKSVRNSVSFTLYYPVPAKLPTGYIIDLSSFSHPTNGVVVFSVDYSVNQKIIFSEQAKPSSSQIQSFYANYLPLRNPYQTTIGQAEIGAYNNNKTLETLVSLPTNGMTWILITAPGNINQSQLEQVISAITK